MRTLNANRFYFDIWADQYYHPDHPETAINRTFYDSIKDMCSYAHELGMRAGVVLFPCQVPPSVYQAFPEARAVEAKNYLGINMCPSKDWDRILTFDTFLLTYMGKNLDDIIVEMQDPGSCLCELCCSQFPDLVNQFIATYRQVSGGPSGRKIDVCTLHFRDWLEDPGDDDSGVAFPITCLRKKVFEMLPEETTIFDIDNSTLDMGRKNSFKNNYFFFDLDPESGMENQQVFPRVKLRRIESQVKDSVSRGHDGIMAYRMMPFVQHIADYVLFRKCWSPELEIDAVLTELAAEWEIPADKRSTFVKAIRDLDAWWEESDVGALEAAGTAIEQLADVRGVSSYLSDSRDLLRVLRSLGRYLVGNRQKVDRDDFYPPKVLVDEVYAIMKNSRIFEAYTIYQHWVNRSREMIGQRTRWWLKGILFELRTADPARAT
jgi:hypothetical protein